MIYDFIVVGAGQAGLAMAYHLKQQAAEFLVIDAEDTIGASWLKRWDSLRLFTPTQYNHLPGMDFPHKNDYYPNKYEVADYLETYVNKFAIPIQLNSHVEHLYKTDDRYVVTVNGEELYAHQVIVATGAFHIPAIPSFARRLHADVVQIHSQDYQNPQQLQSGKTLVVGGGNSGVQILSELSSSLNEVFFSSQLITTGLPQEFLGKTLWWWLTTLGILAINRETRIGQWLSKREHPIIGTDVKALFSRKNIHQVGRALDAQQMQVQCERDTLSDVKNIIWATGYRPRFDWIADLELDDQGYPQHYRGIAKQSGLYFIGLPWLYTRGSATLGGVKADAAYLARYIETTR